MPEIRSSEGNIYIAHAQTDENGIITLFLSRIDPVRGCLVGDPILIADENGYLINSEIMGLVSDGDALWITYQGKIAGQRERLKVMVRKITLDENNQAVVDPPIDLNDGQYPQNILFDGTHLWISHNDGVSKFNIDTYSNFCAMSGTQGGLERAQTALAYTGGEYLWSAEIGRREARVNRIDIYSGDFAGGFEIIEFQERTEAVYEITDMQFDGNHLYVTAYFEEGGVRTGRIHRLLP